MKTLLHYSFMALALLALTSLNAELSTVRAQGTAFTYQGHLSNGGTPANGLYDFRFKLASDDLGDNYVGDAFLTNAIPVTNGLFTATVDFGAGIFTGSNYWLEVDVRTNNPANTLAYTTLAPLQGVTPTPYAIFATTASNVSGTVSAGQLTGPIPAGQLSGTYSGALNLDNVGNSFAGNGANVTNVNATALNGLNATNFWQTSGNSGTTAGVNYLGTADNQPVELHANGLRALRLESGGQSSLAVSQGYPGLNGAPNVIGGSPENFVAAGVVGAVIAGGGATNYETDIFTNSIGANSDFAVIGGGDVNTIQTNSYTSVIAGGNINTIQPNANHSVIGGGYDNTIQFNAYSSTIGGGIFNSIQTNANNSAIGGGYDNLIEYDSPYSTIAGGVEVFIQNNSTESFIGGGYYNFIENNSAQSFIGGGYFNYIETNSGDSTIGGGYNNTILDNDSEGVIAGGYENSVGNFSDQTFIGGGSNNIVGANSPYSTITGGSDNQIQYGCPYSTIDGGSGNYVGETYYPTNAFVAGGFGNDADGNCSFVAGSQAYAYHQGAFVWADTQAGRFTSATNNEFSIRSQNGVRIQSNVGIHLNAADEPLIVRDWDVFAPNAPADKAGIGRWGLFMEPDYLTIGIPSNDVSPRYFQIAKYSTNGIPTQLVQVDQSGNIIAKGTVTANGVLLTSDRNVKENFTPVDSQTVLAKVAALPVTEWNYKSDSQAVQHIGPMAQDFQAAFRLDGGDDKHISVVDEGGVALAAIQGLNRKLEETQQAVKAKDDEIQILRQKADKVDSLETQLNQLKQMVQALAERK